MECDDAAFEGLTHIGDGPLWVAGEDNRSRLPEDFIESRAPAVDMMSWATSIINGLEHVPATDATEASDHLGTRSEKPSDMGS